MLPFIPGPDPRAVGALALLVAIAALGAVTALVALLGWTTHELLCLVEGYDAGWPSDARTSDARPA